MKQVKLEGPCKAPLEFQLQGTLQASPDPKALPEGEWFTVNYVNQFTLSGTGIFDGQGKAAWAQNDCAKTKCAHLPYVSPFHSKIQTLWIHIPYFIKTKFVIRLNLYDIIFFLVLSRNE